MNRAHSRSSPQAGTEAAPRVSFALPVRNGIDTLDRCVNSLLAQDYSSFEVVISDNASDDGTRELLQEYAARDSRIRLLLNERNSGQIENCNRVIYEARGEFVRWIGIDDWVEPNYATRCVETFDRAPDIIGVSTNFRIVTDDGRTYYEDYHGERLESALPERRFARMLWYFHASERWYDMLYSMFRRSMFVETGLLRMMNRADHMLAAKVSLLGRCEHLHECLAHRQRAYKRLSDRENLMKRYHPTRYRELPAYPWRLLRVLFSVIREVPLTPRQQRACRRSALRFFVVELYRRIWLTITGLRRSIGIRRANIPFVSERKPPLGTVMPSSQPDARGATGSDAAQAGVPEAAPPRPNRF